MTLTVEDVSSAGVRLRLDGSVLLASPAGKGVEVNKNKGYGFDGKYLGYLNYNANKKAFVGLVGIGLVLLSNCRVATWKRPYCRLLALAGTRAPTSASENERARARLIVMFNAEALGRCILRPFKGIPGGAAHEQAILSPRLFVSTRWRVGGRAC
jgi:hypothetical protein